MNYFIKQYKYNVELIINNISKEYNINKNDLMLKFYPKKISKVLKTSLTKYISKKSDIYGNYDGDVISGLYFSDEMNNLYYILNPDKLKYNNYYDAIKVSSKI